MVAKARKSQPKEKKHSRGNPEHSEPVEPIANAALDQTDIICALLLGLLSLALYVYTLYPSIPGGDSGELITAAHELGVAHPPGYPLFTLLAWLSIKLIPIGSVAWRVNLLTAILSSGAAFLFALTVFRNTQSRGAAILGVCFWCFSKLTWTWSITAEVFGMNNLFTAALLYLMTCFQQADPKGKAKLSVIGAFVCGLSLCNQHTMAVYVVLAGSNVLYELQMWIAMLLLLLFQKCSMFDIVQWLKIFLSFLAGFIPYIYLPLSAFFSRGRWTWGDQRSIGGFLKHILRREYGTFNLGKDYTGAGLLPGLSAYGRHCVDEFTIIGVILLFVGIFYFFQRYALTDHSDRSTVHLVGMLVMVTAYLLFFTWRANLDVNSPLLLGVVERFWMQSDCVIVLFICLGYSYLCRLFQSFTANIIMKHVELVLALAIAGYHIHHNFAHCNQRDNTVVREFGSQLLENMPKNALVLTKGDLPSNTLRYLYLCENMRPDIQLFDQEVLTYDWSVQMMREAYPGIKFPGHHMHLQTGILKDGTRVFNFEHFLDANNNSATVACIGVQDHDSSWQNSYSTFPFGPCQLLIKRQRFEVEQWIPLAQNISARWKYPFQGFDATSWECVATDEMWQAKISIAFALYDHAVRAQSTEEQTQIMIRSYQLYSSAISQQSLEEIPTYWHKNYGLVCQRLLSLKHDLPVTDLLDKAIFHYEMFVKLDPMDEHYKAITEAVKQMKVQRQSLNG